MHLFMQPCLLTFISPSGHDCVCESPQCGWLPEGGVVVELLLKHQPLFSSLACVGPLLGETSQSLPVATERLSYLFCMIQLHTMKPSPPQPR